MKFIFPLFLTAAVLYTAYSTCSEKNNCTLKSTDLTNCNKTQEYIDCLKDEVKKCDNGTDDAIKANLTKTIAEKEKYRKDLSCSGTVGMWRVSLFAAVLPVMVLFLEHDYRE